MRLHKGLEKLVEAEFKRWFHLNSWYMDIYDSKATFTREGIYRKSKALKIGTPDYVGCCPLGYGAFVELKASGKENVCRYEQREFLIRKIKANAFGLVTSSPEHLKKVYEEWLGLRISKEAQDLLINYLPKKVLLRGKIVSL